MSEWRIETRRGREYLVQPPTGAGSCGAEHDGWFCSLREMHGGDEHVAALPWHPRGTEVCARWPVAIEEGEG